jgi:hypothetical protein
VIQQNGPESHAAGLKRLRRLWDRKTDPNGAGRERWAVKTPRWVARVYARWRGYAWGACPICRRQFGGHETDAYTQHWHSIPDRDPFGARLLICRDCARAGLGCYAHARRGGLVHIGCGHAELGLAHARGEVRR